MFVFFFQAEDGIRDLTVTGVQTCALPIYAGGPVELVAGEGVEIGAERTHVDARVRHGLRPVDQHHRAEALGSRDEDRKSTRLNSSHSQTSYAVFCLKKNLRLHRAPPAPRAARQ